MKLGEKIKELRKKRKLTLNNLASLTESSISYIWEIENGKHINPSAEKLNKIAEALKTTIEYLINNDLTEQSNIYNKIRLCNTDIAFFRKYKKADKKIQDQLQRIFDVILM